ncbi:YcjF family protein [Acidisphaera sp. S103]|uniref:YcjF family protein n=1 Tax=Acidisphaera sp. S103 TaxID=1747223 RepID=UPI00131B08D1|nr:DUF697 domain-containing protein [Acidisphaera sp. S103]
MDNVARGEKARRLAHSYVGWAVGAGLIPFPLVDVGSLVVLQVKMLTEIAEIYETPLGRERARTLVMSTMGSLAPQGVALTGIPALLKFVPILGTLLGVAVMPAAAAASTLALAEIFIRHIETHGRVPDRAWPQLTDSQAASPNLPLAPSSETAIPSPTAEFAVNEPAEPQPAATEPAAPDGPAATEEPNATEPAADLAVVADPSSDEHTTDSTAAIAPADEHTTQFMPEEPSDEVVPSDPASTEQPVRRGRSAARTRRRSPPTETS